MKKFALPTILTCAVVALSLAGCGSSADVNPQATTTNANLAAKNGNGPAAKGGVGGMSRPPLVQAAPGQKTGIPK